MSIDKRASSGEKNKLFAKKDASFFKTKKLFFKSDILIGILLIIALGASLFLIFSAKPGEFADVYFEGELIASYRLDNDGHYEINRKGENTIVIESGEVHIYSASCKDQICVHTGAISKAGQRIICAPNGIVIIIRGENTVDGITGVAA